ncbi:hypothetical protein [Streptomyces sp. DT18]
MIDIAARARATVRGIAAEVYAGTGREAGFTLIKVTADPQLGGDPEWVTTRTLDALGTAGLRLAICPSTPIRYDDVTAALRDGYALQVLAA